MVAHSGSDAKDEVENPSEGLVFQSASQLARRIAVGDLSAREVMLAFLARIDQCNPRVNAICTRIPDEDALALADQADAARRRGDALGPLHGLPLAVKDLALTKGIRTTMGSRIFADNVPTEDGLMVQRLKQAGALIIGKTNTPEFGTGSQTFNDVFGATRNPYDLSKTAGGSSGGAAAALACNMLPIADGSDMGGSLRNPAAFCNVVGLRPSLGRVPTWPNPMIWQSRLGVEGPMARNVSDCALLLSVQAGPDERDPLSLREAGPVFRQPLHRDFSGARVGWTRDLGFLPVESCVINAFSAALPTWEAMGCTLEEQSPSLQGAMDAFKTLRASYYAEFGAPLLQEHRHLMKDTVIENIEDGLRLTGSDITRADALRSQLYQACLGFFEHYDYLILPSTQVQPFDVDLDWVRQIGSQTLESYLDWMSIACIISLFGLPAISVPAGFTPAGLPVGLQIVGRPRDDLGVLQAAFAFEQATQFATRRPELSA